MVKKAIRYFEDKSNRSVSEDNLFTRRKKIAWLVSHCETNSEREKYAKELSRYIPVDVYGKCGKDCPGDCLEMIRVK